MQEVHEHGILHRDIKPQNIIFKPDGRLALIDFGAVREGTGTEFATAARGGTEVASHMVGGTSIVSAGYTAPEQMNGQALKQSDFYSLGRTFIFLLTGKEPSEIPYDAHEDVLQWRKYAPDVEEKLAELLDQMQSTLVRLRPKSAEEIVQKLNTNQKTVKEGEDIELQLEISAEEAAKGASKAIELTRYVNVNGNRQQETTQLTVTVPQGVKDGQKLRLKEKGNSGEKGGTFGDVYICLNIKNSHSSKSKSTFSEQPKTNKFKPSWLLVLFIIAIPIAGIGASNFFQTRSYSNSSYTSPSAPSIPSSSNPRGYPRGYPKAECGNGAGFKVSVLYTEENFRRISQDFCQDVATYKNIVKSEEGISVLQVASFRTKQDAADFEQVLMPYFPNKTYRVR